MVGVRCLGVNSSVSSVRCADRSCLIWRTRSSRRCPRKSSRKPKTCAGNGRTARDTCTSTSSAGAAAPRSRTSCIRRQEWVRASCTRPAGLLRGTFVPSPATSNWRRGEGKRGLSGRLAFPQRSMIAGLGPAHFQEGSGNLSGVWCLYLLCPNDVFFCLQQSERSADLGP